MADETILTYRDCSLEKPIREATCEIVERLADFHDELNDQQKLDVLRSGLSEIANANPTHQELQDITAITNDLLDRIEDSTVLIANLEDDICNSPTPDISVIETVASTYLQETNAITHFAAKQVLCQLATRSNPAGAAVCRALTIVNGADTVDVVDDVLPVVDYITRACAVPYQSETALSRMSDFVQGLGIVGDAMNNRLPTYPTLNDFNVDHFMDEFEQELRDTIDDIEEEQQNIDPGEPAPIEPGWDDGSLVTPEDPRWIAFSATYDESLTDGILLDAGADFAAGVNDIFSGNPPPGTDLSVFQEAFQILADFNKLATVEEAFILDMTSDEFFYEQPGVTAIDVVAEEGVQVALDIIGGDEYGQIDPTVTDEDIAILQDGVERAVVDDVEAFYVEAQDGASVSITLSGGFGPTAFSSRTVHCISNSGAGSIEVDGSTLTSDQGITVYGEAGDEIIRGGSGSDTIVDRGGNIYVRGGAGYESITVGQFSASTGDVDIDAGNGGSSISAQTDKVDASVSILGGTEQNSIAVVARHSSQVMVDVRADDRINIGSNFGPISVDAQGSVLYMGAINTRVASAPGANDKAIFDAVPNNPDYWMPILAREVEHVELSDAAGADADALDLSGSQWAESVGGNSFANRVVTGADSQTLVGNGGDDTLEGGAGDDTYVFYDGDGLDEIEDSSGTDRLWLDYAPTDFFFDRVGNDLVLSHGTGLADQVTITDHFAGQTVEIFDRGSWSDRAIHDGTLTSGELVGTSGHDVIVTSDSGDTVKAGGGWDRIYGGADEDNMYGDNGNDILYGGAGDDDYRGRKGEDTHVFDDASGSDKIIEYGDSAAATQIVNEGDGDVILLTDSASIDEVAFRRKPSGSNGYDDLWLDYGDGQALEIHAHYLWERPNGDSSGPNAHLRQFGLAKSTESRGFPGVGGGSSRKRSATSLVDSA